MGIIEHPESIYRRECAECGTLMQPAKVLCPANSEHIGAVMHEYVPVEQLAGAVEERDRLRVENARLRGEYADELRESVRFWRFAAYAGWMLWIVAMVAAVVV